jgi:hypothetical protein
MKFRKKPVVIEAKQLTGQSLPEIIQWAHAGRPPETDAIIVPERGGASVRTLEGRLHAVWGDWIIKGIKGEFYPCMPDIFEATYEPVHEA